MLRYCRWSEYRAKNLQRTRPAPNATVPYTHCAIAIKKLGVKKSSLAFCKKHQKSFTKIKEYAKKRARPTLLPTVRMTSKPNENGAVSGRLEKHENRFKNCYLVLVDPPPCLGLLNKSRGSFFYFSCTPDYFTGHTRYPKQEIKPGSKRRVPKWCRVPSRHYSPNYRHLTPFLHGVCAPLLRPQGSMVMRRRPYMTWVHEYTA